MTISFLNSLQPDAARCAYTLALARYAAHLLSVSDEARMVEHLADCGDCRGTLAEYVKNERTSECAN